MEHRNTDGSDRHSATHDDLADRRLGEQADLADGQGTALASDAARSVARIVTPQAGRYLKQLCKHFEHKLPVSLNDADGCITFSLGVCRLRAEAAVLTLSAESSDAANLVQLQDVVARHLIRFAFRETIAVDWQPA